MEELWRDVTTATLLGLVAYSSTNVDNLLLLASMRRGSGSAKPVRLGFLLASSGILLLSISFMGLGYFMPASALGYLGVVPITLGIRQLLFSSKPEGFSAPQAVSTASVAAILFSNSSDTLAAFGPLLVESEPVVVATLLATFVVCASVTFFIVERLQHVIGDQPWIDTLASKGTPIIMILVGTYILMDTATDLV